MTNEEKQRIWDSCKEAAEVVNRMPEWKRKWIEYDMKYNAEKIRQFYKNQEDGIHQ